MRAYLIDPKDRTITTIDIPSGKDELAAMYKAMQCDTVDRVPITSSIDMWVDDEGHLVAGREVFFLGESETKFAGRALVLGHDGQGKSIAAEFPVELLLESIRWTELITSGQIGKGAAIGAVIYGGWPISMIRPAERFLIWSHEHRAWWGPGSNGYVQALAQAGRYSRQHAIQICRDAQGGWSGAGAPPEIPVREIDALAAGLAGRYSQQ